MSGIQRAERVRSLLRANIIYNNGASNIDCVVKNISATGVRIDLPASIAIPDEFELRIPHRNKTFRVRLVRRNGNEIGASFIGIREAEPAVAPDAEARDPSSLERENARLRARVRELSRRLEELGQDLS